MERYGERKAVLQNFEGVRMVLYSVRGECDQRRWFVLIPGLDLLRSGVVLIELSGAIYICVAGIPSQEVMNSLLTIT